MRMKKTIINNLKKQAKKTNAPIAAVNSAEDFISHLSANRIHEPDVDLSESMVSLTWSMDDKFVTVKFTQYGHFQYVRIKSENVDFDHGLAAYASTVNKIIPKIEPHIV